MCSGWLLGIVSVGNPERRGYRWDNVITLGIPRGVCVVSCRCGVQWGGCGPATGIACEVRGRVVTISSLACAAGSARV